MKEELDDCVVSLDKLAAKLRGAESSGVVGLDGVPAEVERFTTWLRGISIVLHNAPPKEAGATRAVGESCEKGSHNAFRPRQQKMQRTASVSLQALARVRELDAAIEAEEAQRRAEITAEAIKTGRSEEEVAAALRPQPASKKGKITKQLERELFGAFEQTSWEACWDQGRNAPQSP